MSESGKIQRAKNVNVPIIGFECSECGEPNNAERPPNQDMCIMCGRECTWELPKHRKAGYIESLRTLELGDTVTVCAIGPVPLKGPVLRIDGNHDFVWFGPEADARMIDVEDLRLQQNPNERGWKIYFIQTEPNEDGEE